MEKFKVAQISLTTLCNGLCRYCVRNRVDTPIEHLDLSIADKIRTDKAFFSGLAGDPIFYPHFFEFIERLLVNNPNIWISIATNGSIHDPDWWRKLAGIMKRCHPFSRVYFGIDGLEDTHHIYRGTDYNKILENLKAFREAGGNAIWQTIHFQYNDHQIDEIEQVAEDLGCLFILKQSREYEKEGALSKPKSVTHDNREELCKESKNEPHCFLYDRNEIWINSDGTAHPCCWLSNMKPWDDIIDWRQKERLDFDAFMFKKKSKELIDLNKHSTDDILKTDYFKFVKENYKDMALCNRTCKIFWSDMIKNLPEEWNDPGTWPAKKSVIKYEDIKNIDLALTSRCNLKCKFCQREEIVFGGRISPIFKNVDFPIDILKRVFTPKFLHQLERVIVCGSLGDPILYNHFGDFIDLFCEHGRHIDVVIHTNGTMYDELFWRTLGQKLKNTKIIIQFAMDGMDSETYLKYRIRGNFEKLQKHIKTYHSAGGKLQLQFLLFKHNEHQVEEMYKFGEKYNAWVRYHMSYFYNGKFERPELYERGEGDLKCRTTEFNQISIDENAVVTPCCHTRPFKMNADVLKNYNKERELLDLNTSTIEAAVKTNFFKRILTRNQNLSVCKEACFSHRRYGAIRKTDKNEL